MPYLLSLKEQSVNRLFTDLELQKQFLFAAYTQAPALPSLKVDYF